MAADPTPISTQVNALIQAAHAKAFAEADSGSTAPPADWIAGRQQTPKRGMVKKFVPKASATKPVIKHAVKKHMVTPNGVAPVNSQGAY